MTNARLPLHFLSQGNFYQFKWFMVTKLNHARRNMISLQHLTSTSKKTIGPIPKSHLACLAKPSFPTESSCLACIGYQDDHMTLTIMDIFKGQDNDVISILYTDNNCAIVIVPLAYRMLILQSRWSADQEFSWILRHFQ